MIILYIQKVKGHRLASFWQSSLHCLFSFLCSSFNLLHLISFFLPKYLSCLSITHLDLFYFLLCSLFCFVAFPSFIPSISVGLWFDYCFSYPGLETFMWNLRSQILQPVWTINIGLHACYSSTIFLVAQLVLSACLFCSDLNANAILLIRYL